MQHLSGGEMEAYLKNKLPNGIVFFGYTNGGTAAGASYSMYCSRPDVYNHQRWVLRKLVPISRALQRAGRQTDPAAKLASAAARAGQPAAAPAGVAVNAEGKVEERKRREAGLDAHHGALAGNLAAAGPLRARRRRRRLPLRRFRAAGASGLRRAEAGPAQDTLVFDEFSARLLEAKRARAP